MKINPINGGIMNQEVRRFTVDLPIDQHLCVKMIAAQEGLTMKEFIIESLNEKIQSHKALERENKFEKAMNKVLTDHDAMFKRLADK